MRTDMARMTVFHAERRAFELVDVEIPELGPGEMLVRNLYATLCRSDVLTVQGKRREKDPTILGHEVVGRVVAMGPGCVHEDLRGHLVRVGDRLTWAIYAADPGSRMSKLGMPQKSEGLFKYGHERVTEDCILHGGLASHIILRRHTPVVVLPAEGVPDRTAAIINCAVATVAGGIRLSGDLEGRQVLVTGSGMLGLVAVAMCRDKGAARVAAMDADPSRLEWAMRFGADIGIPASDFLRPADAVGPGSDHQPFDRVLDFTGHPDILRRGVDSLGTGGSAIWVGSTYPQPPVQIDAESIVRRLLTIRGLHNYIPDDLLAAVDFMERRHASMPFDALVSGDFALKDVEEAFRCAITDNPCRVGIRL